MNDVKNSTVVCEYMAAIVRVFLICTTSVIFKFVAAQSINYDFPNAEIGLQFESEPNDTLVAYGKQAELGCSVSTTLKGKLFIRWMHNGTNVTYTRRKYVREKSSGVTFLQSSLVFTKVIGKKKKSRVDTGAYHCVATVATSTYSAVLISRPAVVNIAEISDIRVYSESSTSSVNGTVRLSCRLNSTPTAEITWIFQNKVLQRQNERFDTTIPGVLFISDLRFSDAGEYRCQGKNHVLNKTHRSGIFSLHVKSAADLISSTEIFVLPLLPTNMTVKKNEQFNLDCATTGIQNINIVWIYRAPEKTSGIIISQTKKTYSILRKMSANTNDTGIYTCVVSGRNSSKNVTQSVHVIVSSPPIIIVNPQSRKLALAARVRFPCLARGYPKPILTWLHNGVQIKPDARVKIITGLLPKNMMWVENEMSSEELVFTSTNSADVGIYQCVASNEYGVNWTAAHLYINDTSNPKAPINLRCLTINSTAVWIYWEQSKNDNVYPQEPIYFKDEDVEVSPPVKFERVYTVAYHPTVGGDETHVPSLENSLAIAGLIPNTSYTFYVRTFGGKSGSDPSEKIMCTTPPENFGILLSSTTKAFVSTISPDLINMIKPVNESVLQLRLINKTTVEINWKMEKPTIEFEKFIISYKKQDEISSKIKDVNFNQKQVLLFGLEPETKYDISLKFIINGTEGEIVTQSILTANFEDGSAGISAESLSSTSVKVKWTQSANVTSQYKIKYRELNSNMWLDASQVFDKSNDVIITDLQPDTVYLVQVWLHNNVNNFQDEETLITSLQVRTLSETSPVVPNLFFQPLNATAVRIWWDGLRSLEYKGKLFVVTYLPFSTGLEGSNTMLVPGNKNTVDITNLKPNVKYSVTVGVKSNTVPTTEGKTIYFTLSSDFVHKTQESEEYLEAAGFYLTEDQLWGILIGSGIAAIFVLICLFIYFCCKRHLEKHRHQMLNRCRSISSQNEKHEMKMLSKNSNCYQAHHVNGRNSSLNLHLPLLLQNSNFSNESVQNMNVDGHCKYYDLQAKVIREESDQLLNSDSLIEETCLTLREVNEHDHGGGDSGYCDRNHLQSPQIKEYDSIRRFRKSSDVTLDDGFYENELQETSGKSPSESNRLR